MSAAMAKQPARLTIHAVSPSSSRRRGVDETTPTAARRSHWLSGTAVSGGLHRRCSLQISLTPSHGLSIRTKQHPGEAAESRVGGMLPGSPRTVATQRGVGASYADVCGYGSRD